MVTGFNTDVPHNGKVYHVQTEDRGLKNPIIESLVYVGGEILLSRKTPYTDLLESGAFGEDVLAKRMEVQHKSLMGEIRAGVFDAGEDTMPFGHAIVTNRSFDDVVRGFLEREMTLDELRLALADTVELHAGDSPRMRLQVVEGDPERPVPGATVVVSLIAGDTKPRELFAAPTGDDGWVEAAFEIPARTGNGASIVCHAEESGRVAELTQLVHDAVERSVDPA